MSDTNKQTEMKIDHDKAAQGIEHLAAQASFIDSESQLFTPQAPQAKKGRGRPKKVVGASAGPTPGMGNSAPQGPQVDPQQAQVHISSKEILKPTFLVMSGWLGRAIDEKAKLKDEEIEQLSGAYGLLFDKYAPIVSTKYGLEISVAAITATVGMRIYAVAKEKSDAKKAQMKKERAQFNQAERVVETEIVMTEKQARDAERNRNISGSDTYPVFGQI